MSGWAGTPPVRDHMVPDHGDGAEEVVGQAVDRPAELLLDAVHDGRGVGGDGPGVVGDRAAPRRRSGSSPVPPTRPGTSSGTSGRRARRTIERMCSERPHSSTSERRGSSVGTVPGRRRVGTGTSRATEPVGGRSRLRFPALSDRRPSATGVAPTTASMRSRSVGVPGRPAWSPVGLHPVRAHPWRGTAAGSTPAARATDRVSESAGRPRVGAGRSDEPSRPERPTGSNSRVLSARPGTSERGAGRSAARPAPPTSAGSTRAQERR